MSKYEINEETMATELLKKVAGHWPDTLWLFAADGKLYVMKYNEDGEHVFLDTTGNPDPDYVAGKVDLSDVLCGQW